MRDINLGVMNFGKLASKIPAQQNIVYYRRGFDELSLNITNACPNACTFCIRDRDAGWGVSNLYLVRDPSIEEINTAYNSEHAKIADEGIKLERVKICGYGEPVLRFNDLHPILENIRARGIPPKAIQLTTTGWPFFRFISPDATPISKLKDSGLTDVYLSMSSPNKEVYNKLVRPGVTACDENAFDDAIRFGEASRDAGLEVTLGFINLAHLDKNAAKAMAERMRVRYKIREFEG